MYHIDGSGAESTAHTPTVQAPEDTYKTALYRPKQYRGRARSTGPGNTVEERRFSAA